MPEYERTLLKYHKEFAKCYSIALDKKRCQQISKHEIESINITELCDAINRMHINEIKVGGGHLWHITSQLVSGTVLYHERQVQFTYEETRLLLQSCLSRFVVLQKTQTIKRRTQELHTKNKRRRVVVEEITNNVFVWDKNQYQQDENDNCTITELEQPDPCMRASNEITLRDGGDYHRDNEQEDHEFSHINDFGDTFMATQHPLFNRNDEEDTDSEMSTSRVSEDHSQATFEENPMEQDNILHGDAIENDDQSVLKKRISCETIPPTPLILPTKKNLTRIKKRIAEPQIDDVPEIPTSPLPDYDIPHSQAAVDNNPHSPATDDVNIPLAFADDIDHSSRFAVDNMSLLLAAVKSNPSRPIEAVIDPPSPFTDRGTPSLLAAIDNSPIGIESPASSADIELADPIPVQGEIILLPPKIEPIDTSLLEISQPLLVEKRKTHSAPKRKNRSIRIDDVIKLDISEMRERIMEKHIDCKRRYADIVQKREILLRKEATFFTEPIMFGQCNRKAFKRHLLPMPDDLSIIHVILNITEEDQPDSIDNNNTPQNGKVLEGDTIRRKSSSKRMAHDAVATPSPGSALLEVEDAESFTPPDMIAEYALNSLEAHMPSPDDQATQQRPKIPAAQIDGNDEIVWNKLRALWKRNVNPITLVSINSSDCKRLEAAKNFASILSLKKLQWVDIEADENNHITHIAKGNASALQNIP